MQGVTEVCSECEFDPHQISDDQLGSQLLQLATGYQAVIADASASACPALSVRPSPQTWSILEYAGHVEFVVDFVAHMCEVAASDELAPLNPPDPDDHVNESNFNKVDSSEMSARIRSASGRAKAALDGLDSDALDWMMSFNGNPAPLRLLTVAMVHDSHHHLCDITKLAAS